MIENVEAENVQNVEEATADIGDDGEGRKVGVSTGCGPSPDREIEEIFANEKAASSSPFTPLREIPSRSSKVSIGTSPPPQSISTQVTAVNFF